MRYATVIELNEKNLKVCEDIAKKDNSFKFIKSSGKIIIYSDSKDTAIKRGMWFKYKVGAKYDVLEVVK